MDTGELLLKAVLEYPDEDTPRLAYADWLQEQASAVTCHICGGKGGWDSIYHGRGHPPHWCRCSTCEGTGLEPDGVGYRVRGIRWMLSSPKNSWVCLCNFGKRPCNPCEWLGESVADIPRRTDGETHYVVNRGFVSEVRCVAADWIAMGSAIVTRHPVERVVLSDQTPDATFGGFGWYSGWVESLSHPPTPACVHPRLFARLIQGPGVIRSGASLWYPDEASAYDALSKACLAWARAASPVASPV